MKNIFKRLITDFIEKDIREVLPRDYNMMKKQEKEN